MTVRMVQHKDGQISYLRGGKGTPFILLHGIPGSSQAWSAVAPLLAENFDVIVPDLVGFGASDPPDGDYYMESQALALLRLLERLGIHKAYLGGHDFGGPVALTLMRLGTWFRVEGLFLSATNLFTDTYIPPPLRLARFPIIGSLFFWAMAENRMGIRMLHFQAVANKSAIPWKEFRNHLTSSGLNLTRRIFQRSLADLKLNYGDIEASLPHIRVPTLILWGDRDPFFAVNVGERTCRAIPGSVLKILPGTGHFVPEENGKEVARQILEFFTPAIGGGFASS